MAVSSQDLSCDPKTKTFEKLNYSRTGDQFFLGILLFELGAIMATVKCIKIDSKNEAIRYEYLDTREVSDRYRYDEVLRKPNKTDPESVVLNFDDATIEDAKELPRNGFILWSQALQPRMKKKTYLDAKCGVYPVIGDAVIVSYRENVIDGKPTGKHSAVDTRVTLEEAERLIVQYSDGVMAYVPEFTCMVTEIASQPGYEIQLRLESEGMPRWDSLGAPVAELNKPIQSLSPQMITFAFSGRELTIMTGRISNLDEKVHVAIYESDRPDMRNVAACTLTANKVAGWVKDRLEDFFFKRLVADPFNEEMSFKQSMDEMHRQLGID